jgi:NADH-quinone oxidoreductase subunit G
MLDQERCVLCLRCVRFCRDITKTNELGVINRADHSVIGTFPGYPLNNPYAMNVVDLCPVGALTNKDFRFKQRIWFLESFEAICNGCSKGCNIHVDHRKEKYKDDQIFRFRPRVNRNVNGWFMCDEGRLSYKNDSENRFETLLIDKKESDLNSINASIFKELTSNKNTLILLGTNLSYEEILNARNLASKLNISISGYSPNTIDETFGDDFLRKNDRSANRASFKELEIDETKEFFEDKLSSSSLVIIIENSYFDDNIKLLENKKVISFFSHNCSTIYSSNIAIPVASFYEKTGTYINCDGIKQKVVSQMNKNNPQNTITTILEDLKSMIEKGAI